MPLCSPWEYDPTCCDLVDPDPDTVNLQTEVASDILWRASGMRYGTCEVTVRPCLRKCGGGGWTPYKGSDGAWRNYATCGCSDTCSCVELCEVVLPGPVASVTEVLIDGVALDPSDYRLDVVNGGWRLLRTDGACWPACSDFTADCDEDGSFCITYEQGIAVDAAGTAALSELVCNLVKACIGQPCLLPRNVQSVVRRGVAVTFDTDSGSWLYSLPNVAAWLNAVNPNKLPAFSGVWSPDIPAHRVTSADAQS